MALPEILLSQLLANGWCYAASSRLNASGNISLLLCRAHGLCLPGYGIASCLLPGVLLRVWRNPPAPASESRPSILVAPCFPCDCLHGVFLPYTVMVCTGDSLAQDFLPCNLERAGQKPHDHGKLSNISSWGGPHRWHFIRRVRREPGSHSESRRSSDLCLQSNPVSKHVSRREMSLPVYLNAGREILPFIPSFKARSGFGTASSIS